MTDQVRAADRFKAPAALPALAKEDEECEDNSDKEMCQVEEVTIHSIRVTPLVLELFQDLHAGPHEGPSLPSSMGTEVVGEAAGDLQSASPALAGLRDAEPTASAVATAAEEAGHCVPLSPVAQEEAKTPASLVFGEQATAAKAESQAPAPLSPTAYAMAVQDVTKRVVREVLIKAVAAQQRAFQ